jgi:sulfoquinovose isomerase
LGWRDSPGHRAWLGAEAERLLAFYESAADWTGGGFFWLDENGRPELGQPKELWINARLVHCFALGGLLGRPGCGQLVEHGLRGLHDLFRDPQYGGWYAAVGPDGPTDDRKQTYSHAFVLLAACTAAQAGHDTQDLIQEASGVIATRMLERGGLYVDEWDRAWTVCGDYRGQNANMHLAEAFLAAADATGDDAFTGLAVRIAERIIGEFAAADNWRVPEHYDSSWRPVPDFNADRPRDLFRPYGTIPGHSLEWARLLIQLRERAGTRDTWMFDAATKLFARAVADAWVDRRTGFAYTVGVDGAISAPERFHWVIAEAIGAAAYLHAATGDAAYERWYQRFWDHAELFVLDRARGGWHHELTQDNAPGSTAWKGKPDLYHALQATLFGRIAPAPGLGSAVAAENRL